MSCEELTLFYENLAFIAILVALMSSSFWLLGVESRDFSNTEKGRIACKDEQYRKMTTQNGPRLWEFAQLCMQFFLPFSD